MMRQKTPNLSCCFLCWHTSVSQWRKNGLEINSWPVLFLKGEFPWEYYFSGSLLQIIDVFYLFDDGCCESHGRAIASYTAASNSCSLTHQLLLMKHLEKDLQNQAISLIISCAFFHSVIFSLTSLIFLGKSINSVEICGASLVHWFI